MNLIKTTFTTLLASFLLLMGCTDPYKSISEEANEGWEIDMSLGLIEKKNLQARNEAVVVTPYQGTYLLGDVMHIQWGLVTCICEGGSDWSSPNLDIALYYGQTKVTTIATGVDFLDWEYNWTIPETITVFNYTGYRIKITASSNPDLYDFSENFNLQSPYPAISNNTISYNASTGIITGSQPTGGNGTYEYQWYQVLVHPEAGSADGPTYDINRVLQTGKDLNTNNLPEIVNGIGQWMYYKRYVRSGGHSDETAWLDLY